MFASLVWGCHLLGSSPRVVAMTFCLSPCVSYNILGDFRYSVYSYVLDKFGLIQAVGLYPQVRLSFRHTNQRTS